MAHDDNDLGHGHSIASWATVIIMLVAITIGTVAFWFELPVVVFASVGLIIVGAIVGKVLQKAGYGVNGSKYAVKAPK
jgi:hypothetical protein